ncbi:hypothetical protein J437_LFUL006983, partial [Ladona fulva]
MAAKRKWLSLEEKIQVLEKFDKFNMSQRNLAEQFEVDKTQILTILKDRESISKMWRENTCSPSAKKKLKTEAIKIDVTVFEWFCATRQRSILISLKWLVGKIQIAHNICAKIICGESESVPLATTEELKAKVKNLCEGCSPHDIFNCDETELFYNAFPRKTLCFSASKCHGGKNSKQRLTIFLCMSMIGEFKPPVIIGNTANPRCFKGVHLEKVKVEWKSNKNSWMTSGIMMCQPLDLGIVKNFKDFYRKRFLKHLVLRINSSNDLLEAKKLTSIQPSTVTKCFLKAGFPRDQDPKTFVIENDDELFIEIQELVAKLPCDMSTEEYLCVDQGLSTTNIDIDSILESRMSTKHEEL